MSETLDKICMMAIPVCFIGLFTTCVMYVNDRDQREEKVKSEDLYNYEKALGGQHVLKKFNVSRNIETHSSSESEFGFFLFMASGSSSESSVTKEFTHVRFYFENCYKEYQFLDVDISKVLVCEKHNKIEPYVEFVDYENRHRGNTENLRELYQDVTFVKLHCNSNDFAPNININELE